MIGGAVATSNETSATTKGVIPSGQAGDDPEVLVALLAEAGCLVIHGMTDAALRDQLVEELAPHMDAARVDHHDDGEKFYPGLTRRVTALVPRSEAARTMILDPVIAGLCERHLGPNCERYQLHVTAALNVGPGARTQVLHREEDPFRFFPLPRPNLVLATMWAVTGFTADNGGTLLVPGSHRWEADRMPTDDEIVAAEMPAGSVLVWLGGTLHGAGNNISDDWRYGVVITYSVGWVRQEENQYLDITDDAARELSAEILDLSGRVMHEALGFFDPTVRPAWTGAGR